MTDRISVTQSSPATTFYLEADHVETDVAGGRWRIRLYLRAVNGPGGSTGSYFGGSGVQAGRIDGVEFGRHSGTPFLPSGYGNGAQRWRDGPWYVWISGRSARSVALQMHLVYGNISHVSNGSLSLPAIANVPPAPTPVGVDQITPTSARYRFSSAGTGGSAITAWQAQLATNAAFTTGVQTVTSSGTTTFTGLLPATTYYFRSRGSNAVGWGAWSSSINAMTASGAYVSQNGVWVPAPINVSNGSSWGTTGADVSNGTEWENAI